MEDFVYCIYKEIKKYQNTLMLPSSHQDSGLNYLYNPWATKVSKRHPLYLYKINYRLSRPHRKI